MTPPGHTTTRLAGEALSERTGEAERHAVLFERIMSRIYRYFRRVCFDRESAEDLAQETLLRLEQSLRVRTYDPARSFKTWMWLKAHTVFCEWCRARERRHEGLPDEDALVASHDALRAREEELDGEALLHELERRLGTETYECFVLYYQGGLTHQEIAELLGRHRTTVAERIERAHRTLDRLLGRGAKS